MNMYTNTKKSKKFILVLVLLILFNFAYPKQVKALDFGGNISSFFFMFERAVIRLANDMFCDEAHEYKFKDGEITVWMTPESIIKGKFVLFDANIFQEVKGLDDGDPDSEDTHRYYDDGNSDNWVVNGKNTLRNTISGWYYNLLNFAIVALLSVLVYVGIRMITSTISQDKAKYKIMFKDWLVAMCLLILMHYMMIGILNITSMITEAIGTDGGDGNQVSHIMSIIHNINEAPTGDKDWGDVRYEDDDGNEYTLEDAFKYEILLGFMAVLTGLFIWKYLKREFTIIFLILLGPISCITYPIDKISDGKAQAFNKWLTEFIYNVLIQPFHLLLYLVLVGSAVQLANENLIYGLAVLTMLIPAEKFVKEMFGFKDKLGSPLGAMAAGAAGGHLLSKMMKGGSSSGSGGSNNGGVTTIKNKDIDRSVLTSGEGVKPQTTDLPEGNGSEAPQTIDLPEGDGSEAPHTTDLPEGDDSGAPQETDLPEGDDSGAPQEADLPDGDDDGAPANALPPSSDTTESSQNSRNKGKNIKGFVGRAWDAHNQRATEKHGESRFWKRQGIKAGKGVRALTKAGIKGAAALTGGFTSAILGKGFAAGAATGWVLSGKGIDGASNVVKDYADRMRTPEQREKKAFKDFRTDKEQIQKARQSFEERHGRPPTNDEFEKEIEDRYELKSYGMTDEQINDSLPIYQEELQKQINNGKSEKDAKKIAASKTVTSAQWKKRINADKFTDQKAMQNVLDSVSKSLQNSTKCSKEVADDYARQYLINAGRMHGLTEEEIALPPVKQKVTLPSRDNLYGKLKFGDDRESQAQRQEVKAIQDILVEVGFDDEKIERVMSYSTGNNNQEIIESFATNVKYIISNDIKENARIPVGEIQSGTLKSKVIKKESVMSENLEKLGIEKTIGVTDEKVKSNIRSLEQKEGTTKYREIAGKALKGELSKNDKNNLSEKNLEMISKYKSATNKGKKFNK